MFDFHAQVGGVVALLFIVSWSLVCADDTFADIFGDDIDPAFAWTKLMELKNCPSPHVLPSTIIMVNESLTAGARFVNNTKVGSKYECEFECCRDADRAKEKHRDPCNVAVFAEEVVSEEGRNPDFYSLLINLVINLLLSLCSYLQLLVRY